MQVSLLWHGRLVRGLRYAAGWAGTPACGIRPVVASRPCHEKASSPLGEVSMREGLRAIRRVNWAGVFHELRLTVE